MNRSVISAMFLVAGTCIGGGMLALPVATGIAGFLPSTIVMILCWLGMTLSALLLLEVTLWMEEGAHIITMTSRLLGTPGKIASWVLYLFICYASIIAYTAGGGLQIAQVLSAALSIPISKEIGAVLFIFIFGAIVDLGSTLVGRVNAVCFIAMIIAYLGLLGIGIPEVHPTYLTHQTWSYAWMSIPLMLTTFSFQTMVPSLVPYLKKHAKGLRIAIIGGTTITFIIYALWQFLILGIVPVEGAGGLTEAFQLGHPPTQFLREHVSFSWVGYIAEFFAFFSIATSFLGIGLGLFDFLSDGLKIKKEGIGKLSLASMIIIPTLLFATLYERVFLVALELSGGIGDSLLNGIFPILMVWIGRYYQKRQGPYQLMGGKPMLVFLFLFFLTAFVIQIIQLFPAFRLNNTL